MVVVGGNFNNISILPGKRRQRRHVLHFFGRMIHFTYHSIQTLNYTNVLFFAILESVKQLQ